jgi:hypothetical protein
MIMNKILILLTILIIGCAAPMRSTGPTNVVDQKTYQQHHDWCMTYGTINKQPVYTETYKQCMERFGYKYE